MLLKWGLECKQVWTIHVNRRLEGVEVMAKDDKKKFSDFSNVRNQKNHLIPEEFPEGPFGSSINKNEPVEGKSTPWEDGQRRQSAFVYPYKELHEDLPRQIDGAHPIHDHPDDVTPEQEE